MWIFIQSSNKWNYEFFDGNQVQSINSAIKFRLHKNLFNIDFIRRIFKLTDIKSNIVKNMRFLHFLTYVSCAFEFDRNLDCIIVVTCIVSIHIHMNWPNLTDD